MGEAHAREAFRYYSEALHENPTYDSAAAGAYRALRQTKDFSEAYSLTVFLLQNGATESAARGARDLALLTTDIESGKRMLAAILQYYVADSVDERRFSTSERLFLEKLTAGKPALSSSTREITMAFLGNFEPPFDRVSARHLFPSWTDSPWASDSMSNLLKYLGTRKSKDKDWQSALARYSAAFLVNPGNSGAAVDAAALLRDHKDLLDSSHQQFDRLLGGVFIQKGDYYEKQDWSGILRLHVVLGTVFEAENKWGSRTEPASAIFQWEHALAAERQLPHSAEKPVTVPVLHMKLANAYEHSGNRAAAQEQYVEATDEFLTQGDRDAASQALGKAKDVFASPSPDLRQKIEILGRRLAMG